MAHRTLVLAKGGILASEGLSTTSEVYILDTRRSAEKSTGRVRPGDEDPIVPNKPNFERPETASTAL